jgi:hypothetical protein
MEEVGLIPSDTGQPGGKKTGQRMTHYVDPDGLFQQAFNQLKNKALKYTPQRATEDDRKTVRRAAKTKYECPCGNKVWGKAELHLVCVDCNQPFVQTENT